MLDLFLAISDNSFVNTTVYKERVKEMTGLEAKKLLKQNGINTKFIKAYMHGSSLRVRIMSKEICSEKVKKILCPHERVNRCEYTGDILSGGNFFIFVQYHWSLD